MRHLLEEGNMAPSFALTDVLGESVDSNAYLGHKWMLSFYRYAECLFCNLRTKHLMDRVEEWDAKGFKMVAVWQSPQEDMLKYMEKHKPPYPVIPDPKRSLYKEYGVETHNFWGFVKGCFHLPNVYNALKNGYMINVGKGSKTLIPADFLIDEEGRIIKVYYGTHIGDHLPIEVINDFVNSRNQ